MATSNEMQSFAARLNTFHGPHQLSKRRASSQSTKKKGGGNTIEWPHERPAPEDLARAGFFYRPAHESRDNVQCFFCTVRLDGWEPDDDPVKEHLAHSASCPWALCLQAGILAQQHQHQQSQDGEEDVQDPMHDALVSARKAIFTAGAGWPHEGKRGWKCKVAKMVEAGWCFDPAPVIAGEEEGEGDGVSCFYCNLALDGWEPKDDPMEEHRRRSPECAFFALVERFGSGGGDGKKTKGKGKGKGKGERASTASKASRMSMQSVVSTFSEPPSLADVGVPAEDAEAGVDDSVVSAASQATATGTTKGKKKGGRAKATAKGAKGRKRANTGESEVEAEPLYPDLSSQFAAQPIVEEGVIATATSEPAAAEESAAPPAKKTRKGTRQSKQQLDSSVVEISSLDVSAPKKTTRGRKAKAQTAPQPEPETEGDADHSEVSAQLQEELERSMDWDAREEDATPQPPQQPTTKGKRGVKRTSDGLKKKQESEDVSAVLDEFPVPPPKPVAPAKGKKGRKPSKQVVEESQPEQPETQDAMLMSESEPEPAKPTKAKKAPAKKGAKGRKASSTRSSKATTTAESAAAAHDEVENLEQDEREIEAELQRIANEQRAMQVQAEQDKIGEFEPSPHAQKHVNEILHLEEELRAEVRDLEGEEGKNMANYVASVAAGSPPPHLSAKKENATPTPSPNGSGKENEPSFIIHPSAKQPHLPAKKHNATPSPNGSDKENQPSSWIHPSAKRPAPAPILSPTKTHLSAKKENVTPSPNGSDKENQPSSITHPSAKQPAPAPILSPTKTTRIPLAQGTPNRSSPSKRGALLLSPSKQLSHLTSTHPWEAVDINSVFLTSPKPTPGTLAQRLAGAAGGVLTSPEKGLTVEEWVRFRAEKGEEQLRRGCEEMVSLFEREGMRALESLGGIEVVGA